MVSIGATKKSKLEALLSNFTLSREKLDNSNYSTWASNILLWISGQGYKEHLTSIVDSIPKTECAKWLKLDAQLCSVIKSTIYPSIKPVFRPYATCESVWSEARALYTNDAQCCMQCAKSWWLSLLHNGLMAQCQSILADSILHSMTAMNFSLLLLRNLKKPRRNLKIAVPSLWRLPFLACLRSTLLPVTRFWGLQHFLLWLGHLLLFYRFYLNVLVPYLQFWWVILLLLPLRTVGWHGLGRIDIGGVSIAIRIITLLIVAGK